MTILYGHSRGIFVHFLWHNIIVLWFVYYIHVASHKYPIKLPTGYMYICPARSHKKLMVDVYIITDFHAGLAVVNSPSMPQPTPLPVYYQPGESILINCTGDNNHEHISWSIAGFSVYDQSNTIDGVVVGPYHETNNRVEFNLTFDESRHDSVIECCYFKYNTCNVTLQRYLLLLVPPTTNKEG